jgi:hypothetical protein
MSTWLEANEFSSEELQEIFQAFANHQLWLCGGGAAEVSLIELYGGTTWNGLAQALHAWRSQP